jgi:hypothetical protein
LKLFDLSAVLIRLESDFNDKYYDRTDRPLPFKGNRPYFIWIFGNYNQIKTILDTRILNNIKGGYSNRHVFNSTRKATETGFKILSTSKIGDFSREQLNNKIITEASVSKDNRTKGLFGFSLAVDFSNSMQNSEYFMDTGNYRLSDSKYILNVSAIEDKNDPTLKGYTHILKLQTSELRDEDLRIEVPCRTPKWVLDASSSDDSNFLNDREEQWKTFGLRHLFDGVIAAFCPESSPNSLNTISVKIKR